MSGYKVFQDWAGNEKNPKARLILLFFRVAHFLADKRGIWTPLRAIVGVTYRLSVEWVLGVELPWKLKIGPGIKLYHGQALVINDNAVIGSNCVLRHSTTIGISGKKKDNGQIAPIIGNGVDIGANVVILGPVTIGSNVKIGAGSVVAVDLPDDCTVVGNPARIISKN